MKWTTELDTELIALYSTHTRNQIAQKLGLTEGQVRSRFYTLGMATKVLPWSDDDIAAMYAEYKKPYPSVKALAARIGRDAGNVSRKAGHYGLTDPVRKKKPPELLRRRRRFSNEQIAAMTSIRTKAQFAKHGHPRGMLGKKHSHEVIKIIAAASRKTWADPASGHNTEKRRQQRSDQMVMRIKEGKMASGYNRTAGGKRADLGNAYFRSSWEANYARFLNFLVASREIIKWEYEPHVFEFEKIKRGTRTYKPDFKVYLAGDRHEWHEVKGWMDAKSKTRLDRMARYFPLEKIVLIDEKWFRDAYRKGLCGLLPGWESGGKNRGSRGC